MNGTGSAYIDQQLRGCEDVLAEVIVSTSEILVSGYPRFRQAQSPEDTLSLPIPRLPCAFLAPLVAPASRALKAEGDLLALLESAVNAG